jgi:hypothetical protein
METVAKSFTPYPLGGTNTLPKPGRKRRRGTEEKLTMIAKGNGT